MRTFLPAAAALAALTLAAGTTAVASPTPATHEGFRVLPYLQKPAATSMTINWISETDTPGTVEARSIVGTVRATSTPEHLPILNYTEAELSQQIKGLEQGSWLKGADNHKHSVTLTGLRPHTRYRYTVTQDGHTHTSSFTTAPTADSWNHIRVVAFSDTETEPKGRVEQREWEIHPTDGYAPGSVKRPGEGSVYADRHGSKTRYGQFTLRYPMSQDRALQENVKVIEAARPDLLLVAGDLSQGGGYQPAWDEYFRYFAGEHSSLASRVPMLTALGNWETYAALNNGYGTAEDRSPVVISRNKYHAYFDTFGDEAHPEFKGSYHRVDHGPLTVITLDSTNGVPDENVRAGLLSNPVFSGDDTHLTSDNLSTDTQGSFTAEEYKAAHLKVFGTDVVDLPAFNPGTAQWAWAREQLADARAKGQVIVVQFHHAPYSNGVHGTPPNHEHADNQSGVAMRVYSPMFDEFGVAAVIAGHDEMFERSFDDPNGDGRGFQIYDVGIASDGLRGEQLAKGDDGVYRPIRFNSHSRWMAATDAPEQWVTGRDGKPHLRDGGLHYGHLQMDLVRTGKGAKLVLTPVYLFPHMDGDYNVTRVERRTYNDVVELSIDDSGLVSDTVEYGKR